MHMYVYRHTVHNSKDLEKTQMPINDRLDKENVAHINHGILHNICRLKSMYTLIDRMRSCTLQQHGLSWKPLF